MESMPIRLWRAWLPAVGAALLVLAAVASAAPSTEAHRVAARPAPACNTITFERTTYVFYRRKISCRYAIHLARKVRRTKRSPARGFKCTSGSGFTTGGSCEHRDGRQFGWHPPD